MDGSGSGLLKPGSGSAKKTQIHPDPDPKHWFLVFSIRELHSFTYPLSKRPYSRIKQEKFQIQKCPIAKNNLLSYQ